MDGDRPASNPYRGWTVVLDGERSVRAHSDPRGPRAREAGPFPCLLWVPMWVRRRSSRSGRAWIPANRDSAAAWTPPRQGSPGARRRHAFLLGAWPTREGIEVGRLRIRALVELPPGQATVAQALLVDGPEFEPPEPPVTYDEIALGLGIKVTTVREHIRRIRLLHPELYSDLMAERARRLARWHADVSRRRLERSRRWGKRRWSSRYRNQHGEWPWASLWRDGSLRAESPRGRP